MQKNDIRITSKITKRGNSLKKKNNEKGSTLCPQSIQGIIDNSVIDSIKINNLITKNETKIDENYTIISNIGQGSFGSVYKVKHLATDYIRAMKIIRRDSVKYQDDDKKFLKEIEILMKLEHPNIIKIFEYYTDELNYYLITEYLSGGQLYDGLMTMKNFNEYRAEYIMNQILSAINYLHCNNIVHRDIKPENILIEQGNGNESNTNRGLVNIKLIDFGSCNYITDKNLTMKVGSPYYIAPEVLKRNYGFKCDIWSAGVILHILLVGYPPFKALSKQELFQKIKKGSYTMTGYAWENVSKDAKDLLSHMLEYNQEKRYSASECLEHPWIRLREKEKSEEMHDEYFVSVLEKIYTFNIKEKLQQATIAYIVHSLYSNNEIEDLKKVFVKLDRNGDGKLTYQELRDGFHEYFKGSFLAEINIDKIIKEMDANFDGIISYEEFLRVVVNEKMLLNENNLRLAFERFDLNNDGLLSKEELKSILDTSDFHYIDNLLSVIDLNKDGMLSYDEFKLLMNSVIANGEMQNGGINNFANNNPKMEKLILYDYQEYNELDNNIIQKEEEKDNRKI